MALAAELEALPTADLGGQRLVEMVRQQAPPDQRWATESTLLSLELIDSRGRATAAGRRALAKLEGA